MTEPPPPLARTQDELMEMVMSLDCTLTATMTPEIAGWLLALNTANRPLRASQVERFNDILRNGGWINTGEPIIVSREGILSDGQNRLTAIHQGTTSVTLDVRFGIARAAFVATGIGARRSPGDIASLAGYSSGHLAAAIAKGVYHIDKGQPLWMTFPIEPALMLDMLRNNEVIMLAAGLCSTLTKLPMLRQSWFGMLIVLAARKEGFEEAARFAQAVETRRGDELSGAVALHDRLVRETASRAKLRANLRLRLGIKAWNAWINDRPMLKLIVLVPDRADRSVETFPEVIGRLDARGNAKHVAKMAIDRARNQQRRAAKKNPRALSSLPGLQADLPRP